MRALLLKEMYTHYFHIVIQGLVAVLISLHSLYRLAQGRNPALLFYLMIIPIYVIITSHDNDEKSKWSTLVMMMPLTDRQIVLSKYVLFNMCIAMNLMIGFVCIGFGVYFGVITSEQSMNQLEYIDIFVYYFAIWTVILLPILVYYTERAELALLSIVAAIVAFFMVWIGVSVRDIFVELLRGNAWIAVLIMLGIIVMTHLFSIPIATKFYGKRRSLMGRVQNSVGVVFPE